MREEDLEAHAVSEELVKVDATCQRVLFGASAGTPQDDREGWGTEALSEQDLRLVRWEGDGLAPPQYGKDSVDSDNLKGVVGGGEADYEMGGAEADDRTPPDSTGPNG